ncbi:hypothetical protein O3G_MSEX001499 [Manduca sexta]|uniref:Uncharacterized protein n=1 Tax=Manduca sexta TaxID=7130 RepID=A0A922CCL9_MANSE|nr:hypothetical protein O3G_MSEX001499 [Manduca sexta]
MLRYACFLSVILAVRSASAPFIKPCKDADNACTLASAQAALPHFAPGIPELGVKSLDPLYFDVIKGDQGGLQLTFRDTTVTGMKGCTIEAIKSDQSKGKQQLAVKCSVDLTGDYKLDGQLLIFPIKGEGKYHINIRDIIIKAHTDVVTVTGADGQPHWHIKAWKHTYETKTGAKFNFDNLFNGNKVLGKKVIGVVI